MDAIQTYFMQGTLPSPGTVCNSQKDLPLFSNLTYKDVFAKTHYQPPALS